MTIEYLDKPPVGWFPLDVMPQDDNKREWTALMINVDPDELKVCICEFPALFHVHPNDYRPGSKKARQCFVKIGKHRSRRAAWNALHDMIET